MRDYSGLKNAADKLAIACLAAMLIIPFLHPRHYQPIGSFWPEWWAVALGLATATLLMTRNAAWRPLQLPSVTAIPLLLCLVAAAQIASGHVQFVQQGLLYASMMIWAALMMIVGHRLTATRGLGFLADIMASALLAGALANSLVQLLQLQQAGFASGLVFQGGGLSLGGNLAQVNHFNHQIWLGIASLLYAHAHKKCNIPLTSAGALILVTASTLSTSKSAFAYSFVFALLAWAVSRLNRSSSELVRLRFSAAMLLVLVVAMQGLYMLLRSHGLFDSLGTSAPERFFFDGGGFATRWMIWKKAGFIFLAHPWFGSGIGSFPLNYYLTSEAIPPGSLPGVAEHAHNLPLQLLVELGAVPVVLIGWLLWRWFRTFLTGSWSAERWWAVAVLAVGALHSMLEYPLWYAYFLGIAAMLMGATDKAVAYGRMADRGVTLMAGIAVVGATILALVRHDFEIIELRVNPRLSAVSTSAAASTTAMTDLDELRRNSILAPYAYYALSFVIALSSQAIEQKIAICRMAQKFYPDRAVVFKCAALTALSGRRDEALTEMRRALYAFPDLAGGVVNELEPYKQRYPQLAPLQALARDFASKQASGSGP